MEQTERTKFKVSPVKEKPFSIYVSGNSGNETFPEAETMETRKVKECSGEQRFGLRDLIATPFFSLMMLSMLLAVYIGGRWTAREVVRFTNSKY